MKHHANRILVALVSGLAAIALTACATSRPATPVTYVDMTDIDVPEGFDYSTTQTVNLRITTKDIGGGPIGNVVFDAFHTFDLESEEATFGTLVTTAFIDETGSFEQEIELPGHVETLLLSLNYPGIPAVKEVPIWQGEAYIHFGPAERVNALKASSALSPLARNYLSLGSWDSLGKPNYLIKPNVPSKRLKKLIDSWLPNGKPVPQYNPQYIQDDAQADIIFTKEGEAWVTFLHEGAGYKNMLGYYVYDPKNPPSSADDIKDLTLVFPNSSYAGSGGNLLSGDRVQLVYGVGTANESKTFPAGTAVGWFIVANGWKGSPTDGYNIYFSNPDLNPEKNASKRRHTVLLYDDKEEVLVLAFEDLFREGRTDDDFNDAVFQVEVSSFDDIETENLTPVDDDNLKDSDGDGVNDNYDQYPNDPEKAFNNYFPGANDYGTLAYEDLWPDTGDFDFNDVVVDYRINQISNSKNKVTEIKSDFVFQAVGAAYVNAFAFELPIAPDKVESVDGSFFVDRLGGWNYIKLNENGTEANQSNAVIFVTDDTAKTLGHIVNTVPGGATTEANTITVTVKLAEALKANQLGKPPYNPFIITNVDNLTLFSGEERAQRRGHEVHLPKHKPTDLADLSLFNTGDDASRGAVTYMSKDRLPWALHIPSKLDWPTENNAISWAYYNFAGWVKSGGGNSKDWYLDKDGYRNKALIYKKNKQ